MSVRPPAVAGTFYPGTRAELAQTVDDLLARASGGATAPKAIVAPHAGYVYSGPTAATAYARLAPLRDIVRRVVVLGPSHRVPLSGLAAPAATVMRTPLGDIDVDTDARDAIVDVPGVVVDDVPHAAEHSLEVHFPFLQRVLTSFRILPLAVGHADPATVAAVLDRLWGGPETLFVVSTDLSHYEAHDAAVSHDRRTLDAVLRGDEQCIGPYDACGAFPLRGLITAAPTHNLVPELLDHRTSGDTAGPRDRVVGYASLAYVPA
jgi:AmmeMemoRadiSam system protein B